VPPQRGPHPSRRRADALRQRRRIRRLPRYLPAALVLALLTATGAAFLYTELLKLEPSPIRTTRIDHELISPVCDCPTGKTRISFRLRKRDVLTVSIVDSGGREVRRLATERPVPQLRPVVFTWNGRVFGGKPAPEGLYRPQVRLELLEKTITLPNEIRVDTTKPKVAILSVRPRTISPDDDGRSDHVSVRYGLDEPAQAALRVNGVRRVLGKGVRRRGRLDWFGRVAGRPVPPGFYRLAVVAVDRAGNRSLPAQAGRVRVRYVELAEDAVVVAPRGLVRTLVFTDAASYRWRLAGRTGTARTRRLVVRAPARPGRYMLFVAARGHADRMIVRVRARRR
jgi:hypothetical protein